MQQNDKTQHEIRKIAYDLWIKDGQPEGRDREHWEAAKEIWAFRSHNHVLDEADDSDTGTAKKRRQNSRPNALKTSFLPLPKNTSGSMPCRASVPTSCGLRA